MERYKRDKGGTGGFAPRRPRGRKANKRTISRAFRLKKMMYRRTPIVSQAARGRLWRAMAAKLLFSQFRCHCGRMYMRRALAANLPFSQIRCQCGGSVGRAATAHFCSFRKISAVAVRTCDGRKTLITATDAIKQTMYILPINVVYRRVHTHGKHKGKARLLLYWRS